MPRTFSRPKGRVDYVVNRGSRNGIKPKRVVIHTTQSHNRPGRGDVDAVHAWFDNPDSKASAHVIVDAEGHSTTCVPDNEKSWTQAAYNPDSLSIELVGWAGWAESNWKQADRGLRKAAKFAAYWCREYNIPVKRPNGICGHADLGARGGGHWDPGPKFPWKRFLGYVRYYKRFGWKQ